MEKWIERVKAGDFAHMPADLDFDGAVELAHLINCYKVTCGVIECGEAARPFIDEIRSSGRSTASALDLWIALFYSHRAYRHFGYPPSGDELVVMDTVARELRAAVLRATQNERKWLVELMQTKGAGSTALPSHDQFFSGLREN